MKLGNGIALFQALSNIAINGMCMCIYHYHIITTHCVCVCVCVYVYVYAGVVLGVVCHGGLLLTTDQLTAGQLMAFLVATQTIQRYQDLGVHKSNIIVCVCVYLNALTCIWRKFSVSE